MKITTLCAECYIAEDIGDTIHTYVLEGQRAAYGQQIVSALSTKLTELYGKDFTDNSNAERGGFENCGAIIVRAKRDKNSRPGDEKAPCLP